MNTFTEFHEFVSWKLTLCNLSAHIVKMQEKGFKKFMELHFIFAPGSPGAFIFQFPLDSFLRDGNSYLIDRQLEELGAEKLFRDLEDVKLIFHFSYTDNF